MAIPPISNAGSDYFNINQCYTFGMPIAANVLTCLSSVDVGGYGVGQPCSEIILINRTGGVVTIYDKNNGPFTAGAPTGAGGSRGFVLKDDEQFTFRGITNVNEVSAYGAEGHIQYRAQFFSYNPR
jgi:hypothetical protein